MAWKERIQLFSTRIRKNANERNKTCLLQIYPWASILKFADLSITRRDPKHHSVWRRSGGVTQSCRRSTVAIGWKLVAAGLEGVHRHFVARAAKNEKNKTSSETVQS